MPTVTDLAAFFEVDRDTIAARLAENDELRLALESGRSGRGRSLVKRLHQMAIGFWKCAEDVGDGDRECNAPLTGPKDHCPVHGADLKPGKDHAKRFEKPNVIAAIWVTKNQLSWADRSIFETKYGGDPRKIPDDELLKAVREAFAFYGAEPPQMPSQDEEQDPETSDDGAAEKKRRESRPADPH